MRTTIRLASALALAASAGCADRGHAPEIAREPLNTGRYLTPLDRGQDVGSMPMNLVLSADGAFAITSDMGQREALWAIRTADGRGVSYIEFTEKSAAAPGGEDAATTTAARARDRANGLYYGLAIAPGNPATLYAGQGGHDTIAVATLTPDGSLTLTDSIRTRAKDFPAGLALDVAGRLYVANNAATGEKDDNPFALTASVAIYDPSSRSEVGRYTFSQSYGGTSNFPFGIAVRRDGSRAYVASERDDTVYVLNTTDPAKPSLAATVATGAHPVSVLLSSDECRVYIANSLGDTISVIDTRTDRVSATILLRPTAARDLPGVTPTGLALSPDGRTLVAALSDMNAVAVIDTRSNELRGYIPAGWYPTALAFTPDGRSLLVANAKGTSVRNPSNHPDPHHPNSKSTALLSILEGSVTMHRVPGGAALKAATEEVLANNRIQSIERPGPNPLASIGLSAGKIRHVIYVIKENRTYDQVLGDLPQGNGDPSLVLFGRDITPNQHALAERFVLLDNLYACGEVSGDGWAWSTQGMADAYVARNVPYNYSHRGRKFDFEAHNNGYPTAGFPATDEHGTPLATAPFFKDGAKPIPDIGSTGVNIWDTARAAGLTVRNYGFFLYFTDRVSGTPGGPDNYPVSAGLQPPGHDLAGITDSDFRRFDLDYPDSDAPGLYHKQTGEARCLFKKSSYGLSQMPSRFSEWNREFQMMLAKDPSGAAVPNLMLVRFCTDHTSGASAGKHSPRSCVADNDYALGQLVEAVSRSPIWEHTAILVIEDDAQNGVDHVDAHRMPVS